MIREAIVDGVQKLHADLPMSDTTVDTSIDGKNITVVLKATIDT